MVIELTDYPINDDSEVSALNLFQHPWPVYLSAQKSLFEKLKSYFSLSTTFGYGSKKG
jgi:hypothetical protein